MAMIANGPFGEEFEQTWVPREEPASPARLTAEPETEQWDAEGAWLREDDFESAFSAREDEEATWIEPEAEDWEAEATKGSASQLEDERELDSQLADVAEGQATAAFLDEATEAIQRALEAVKEARAHLPTHAR